MKSKILIIGIDGADWYLTKDWVEKNELSNLKKIVDNGFFNKLISTIPPLSPSAWTSLFTGKKPNEHGIYSFLKQKKDEYFYRPISSKDRTAEPLWISLSKKGYRSIIMNIPFTYPPDIINGIMITGLGTPGKDSNFAYPKKYQDWILNNYPDYNVDLTERLLDEKSNIYEMEDTIIRIEETHEKIFTDLLKKEYWDFSVIVFRSLDVIQHYGFDDKKLLLKHYKRVDKLIGKILKNINTKKIKIILCSDHGFRKVHKKFYVNNWLRKEGYLKFKKDSSLLLKIGIDAEKIRSFLLKINLENILQKIERGKFTKSILKIIPSSSHQYLFNVNWLDSKAFFYRASNGLIKINLLGRESAGIIKFDELETLENEIKQKLQNLKDPDTNQKIFRHVYIKKELDMDSYDMPEILLLPNEGYEILDYNENGKLFKKQNNRPGDHSLYGIFISSDKNDSIIKNRKIWEIKQCVIM